MSADPQLSRLFQELNLVELPPDTQWVPAAKGVRRWKIDGVLAVGLAAGLVVIALVAGAVLELQQRAANQTGSQIPLYPEANGVNPWLTLTLPVGWSISASLEAPAGRASGVRAAQIASRPVDAFSTGRPFPDHLNWAKVPADTVIVEVRDICGGDRCATADVEALFPLVWVGPAQPLSDLIGRSASPGFDARALTFRYFFEGHVIVAYVGAQASSADRALVEHVVASIAPAALPVRGVLHGNWLGVGAFTALPVDEPTFGKLPAPPTTGVGYYVIRHGSGTLAHPMTYQTSLGVFCDLVWDATSGTFSCPGRAERWDRFGRGMQGTSSDIGQFATLTKSGNVYVNFGTLNGGNVVLPDP
jgi:hypothetical protein